MSRPDRYAQCDDTCTVDCGACKGAPRSPVDEMVRLSAEAGLYGDMGAAVPSGGEDRIPNWIGDVLGDHTRPPVDGEGVWTPPTTIGGRWARTNRSTSLYETWGGPEDDAVLAMPALHRLVEEAAEAARLRAVVERVRLLEDRWVALGGNRWELQRALGDMP